MNLGWLRDSLRIFTCCLKNNENTAQIRLFEEKMDKVKAITIRISNMRPRVFKTDPPGEKLKLTFLKKCFSPEIKISKTEVEKNTFSYLPIENDLNIVKEMVKCVSITSEKIKLKQERIYDCLELTKKDLRSLNSHVEKIKDFLINNSGDFIEDPDNKITKFEKIFYVPKLIKEDLRKMKEKNSELCEALIDFRKTVIKYYGYEKDERNIQLDRDNEIAELITRNISTIESDFFKLRKKLNNENKKDIELGKPVSKELFETLFLLQANLEKIYLLIDCKDSKEFLGCFSPMLRKSLSEKTQSKYFTEFGDFLEKHKSVIINEENLTPDRRNYIFTKFFELFENIKKVCKESCILKKEIQNNFKKTINILELELKEIIVKKSKVKKS